MTSDSRKPSFVSLRSIVALILREMSTTYGRSPGGYLWAIVEPVAGITVLTVVFSLMFRNPPLGSNFALFYATGLLPLQLYLGLSNKVSTAIQFSRPLLAYPRVTYVDAILARMILDVLTEVLVGILIFGFIIWSAGLNVSLDFGAIFNALAMAVALGLGIGLVNSFLNSMFPIWIFVWAVLNRPLFIISGVFFLIDLLPEQYRFYLMLNPVAHIISEMRAGFYVNYPAAYVSETYVYLFALIPMAVGLALLHRYHNDILET